MRWNATRSGLVTKRLTVTPSPRRVAPKGSIGTCPNTEDSGGHAVTDDTAERTEFSHWECDLMMFRKEHGKVNVTSLVVRVSRYAVVMRNERRQSKPIMDSLINGLAPLLSDARQSITFDRGTEFSAW